jgi:Raf kinase inhibitor-like YbhB/YbcL family protein
VPGATASLALIVDDPDAPDHTFVHWLVYDLAPTVTLLPEAASGALPTGAAEGKNDFGKLGWRGPCPPCERHDYYFKLYALDAPPGDLGHATKAQLWAAMQGHLLGKGVLVGSYAKK